MKTITLNHWICQYSPVVNKYHHVKYPDDMPLFEFHNRWQNKYEEERFGCEQDFIAGHTEEYVWTGYCKNGERYIVSGLHYIKSEHSSYFITKNPWREKVVVKLDKDDTYYYNIKHADTKNTDSFSYANYTRWLFDSSRYSDFHRSVSF